MVPQGCGSCASARGVKVSVTQSKPDWRKMAGALDTLASYDRTRDAERCLNWITGVERG
jgi:hypothetical protein